MGLYRKKALVVEVFEVKQHSTFRINGREFECVPGDRLIKEFTDTVYVVDKERFEKDFEPIYAEVINAA